MRRCRKCGNKLQKGNKYCSMCGNPANVFKQEVSIKRVIVSVCIVLLIGAVDLWSIINNQYDYMHDTRIFDTISDLSFIDDYVIEDNLEDKQISNVSNENLLQSKQVMIDYNGRKIKIYAYVFSNTKDCLEYAQDVSGNYYEDIYIRKNGKMSWSYYKGVSFLGLFQSEKLIVFSEEKAYVIKAKISQKKFNEFIEFFMEQLPLEVQISY